MFSSNQKFCLTGDLNSENIKQVLEFVENFADTHYESFQIGEDGSFALSWIDKKEGSWTPFQFKYDLDTLANIICNHIEELKYHDSYYDMWDGSSHRGFMVEVISETFNSKENGIKDPFYGIIKFSPYTTFYSK